MEKVLLTGGGTGGHIYPNLALLPALYRLGIDAVYGGGEGDTPEHRAAVAAGLDFYGVPVVKFVRSASRAAIANNLKIPRILARGRAAAKEALLSEKPAVVFSKGGFAALPFVLAAADLGIPVICHESDKTAGLCNKIAARKGAFALSAYPGSRFGVFVGMPVREELFCKNRALARESLGLPPEGKVLLVTGGSSGAKALNDTLAEVLPALRGICTVVHLTGRGKSDGLPPAGEGYLPWNIPTTWAPFTPRATLCFRVPEQPPSPSSPPSGSAPFSCRCQRAFRGGTRFRTPSSQGVTAARFSSRTTTSPQNFSPH